MYRTRAIITRRLYTFYPIYEDQKRFLRNFFCKILALCMVSIQERVMMARVRYIILFCFVFVPTFFFRSTNFHVFEKIDFPFWNMHAFTKWVHYDTNFSAALLGHLFCGASLIRNRFWSFKTKLFSVHTALCYNPLLSKRRTQTEPSVLWNEIKF